MKPVLFTIGSQPISSFGLALLLAFLAGTYIIWRIVKIYELDEEKTLDLIILTFAGGLIFSRIYFILFHLDQFNDFLKIVLINRYPGLSFWGGFFGGFFTLRLLCSRFKLNFWQVADFAAVGFFIGMSIANIGCLLGSCQYGLPSNLPIAITQVSLIDKRFPLQIVEFVLFFTAFIYLWKNTLKFHTTGTIAAQGFILTGIYKFFLEFFYGFRQLLFISLSLGNIFGIIIFLYGVKLYYQFSKKSFISDIKFLKILLIDSNKRGLVISRIYKSWYNLIVNLKLSLERLRKRILRLINVKSNPHKF